MRLQISINLDNDSFLKTAEVQRILRQIADRMAEPLPRDGLDRQIRDINGNTVGSWGIYEE